jgi:hypothetical protein
VTELLEKMIDKLFAALWVWHHLCLGIAS